MCTKAPSVAHYLVQEIQKHPKDTSQLESQGLQEYTNSKRSSKKKQQDGTYRPPKSLRVARDISEKEAENRLAASSSKPPASSVTFQPNQDNKDDMAIIQDNGKLVTKKPPHQRVAQEELQGQKAAYNSSAVKKNVVKQLPAILDKATENGQSSGNPASLSEAEQQKTVLQWLK